MHRLQRNILRNSVGFFAVALMLVGQQAMANGTETLGAASLNVAPGTGIVAAGIGLNSNETVPFENIDGTIEVSVPGGATVAQVILYWSGQMLGETAGINDDDTLSVNGNGVTGTLIGGPAFFFNNSGQINVDGYRADITALGLVREGSNQLVISDLDYFAGRGGNHGAGVIVVIDEGGAAADLQLNDGIDLAFCGFGGVRSSTVPQTYSFDAAPGDRQGALSIFIGSVGMQVPQPDTTVVVTPNVGTASVFSNMLASLDGNFWDTLVIPADIPAGATEITVEVISGAPDDCTSEAAPLSWIAAALEVPLGDMAECGDGILDPSEECDDSNTDPGDGCSETCTLEMVEMPECGDGIVDPNEECDDNNTDSGDGCSETCTLEMVEMPECGDGIVDPEEECDDSNTEPGDGCSDVCTLELACALDVQKYCSVDQGSNGLVCEAKIAATTLRYIGPDALDSTIVFRGKEAGDVTYSSVNLVAGAVLTSASNDGFTVDARPDTLGPKLAVTLNGVEEVIHTSCSAIYEAGQPAPLNNPLGAPSPNWEVVNFIDKHGNSVSETPADPVLTSECTIVAKDTSKKRDRNKRRANIRKSDRGKQSANSRDIHKSSKTSKKSKKTKKKGKKKKNSRSNQVEYSYVITNIGEVDVFDVVAFDDVLDREVAGSPVATLEAGQSTTLTEIVEVDETVTNTVFVSGVSASDDVCEDEASATVTVE